jgi:hypothetical protein
MSGFDDLERQLRGAVREHRAAGVPASRRRWRGGRALALAAALVVPAGGVAVAAGMLGSDDRARAQELFSAAVVDGQATVACEGGAQPPARYSDAAPSPQTLEAFSFLARPAGPGDGVPQQWRDNPRRGPVGGVVLEDHVRRLEAPDGSIFTVVVLRGPSALGGRPTDPERCLAEQEQALAALAAGEPKAVREVAADLMARHQAQWHSRLRGDQLLVLRSRAGATSSGSGTPVTEALKTGVAYVDGAGPTDGPVSYGGLVPDGVAQVVVLADGDEHVGEVTDNVFAVEVPRAAMHGATIQWRDAAGHTIREVSR